MSGMLWDAVATILGIVVLMLMVRAAADPVRGGVLPRWELLGIANPWWPELGAGLPGEAPGQVAALLFEAD